MPIVPIRSTAGIAHDPAGFGNAVLGCADSIVTTLFVFMDSSRKRIMTQHVLFIVSNAAVIGPKNRKTGFFFAEIAHPFDVLD
jgi:hypothetical protein